MEKKSQAKPVQESMLRHKVRKGLRRVVETLHPAYSEVRAIKRVTKTGLPLQAYYRLSQKVKDSRGGNVFLEIGAGAGTSTTVIGKALAAKNDPDGMLFTAEKFEGGHYAETDGRNANIDRFYDLLDRFGVRKYVTLFPHYITEESIPDLREAIGDRRLAGIFIDADGRIDRLLPGVWDMLPKDAPVIFDDYSNDLKYFRPVSDRYPQGGSKLLRCYRMVNVLAERGLIRIDEVIYGTVFTTKITDRTIDEQDLEELKAANASVDEVYKQWKSRRG